MRRLAALFSTPGPSVAVALRAEGVSAVQLAWGANGPAIAGHAHADLAAGLVTPSLTGANVVDAEGVSQVLRAVLDRLPRRPSRVALVVPDGAAKVSLLRFETLPARSRDLDDLVRWRIGKSAPFDVDEAQLDYTFGAAIGDAGREVVAALMRRDVVESYERVCGAAGVHAGVVDVASFNVINALRAAVPAASAGDWLLVHAAAGSSTLAIVRDGAPVFCRNRAVAGARALGDLVHQTAMYYQDRLGGDGLGRAVLAGETWLNAAGGDRAALRRSIEERLGRGVEWLGALLGSGLPDHTGADRRALDALAAPVGVLLRDAPRERRRAAG